MDKPLLNVSALAIGLVAFFLGTGGALVYLANGKGTGAVTPTPDVGWRLFRGRGKCITCHTINGQGSITRCPDLSGIGARAAERARERSIATGRPFTAADYLVESIEHPKAHIVPGYPDDPARGGMPEVWGPDVGLDENEATALLLFLQSNGGTVDASVIRLDKNLWARANEDVPATREWKPPVNVDPVRGREIFEKGNGRTIACATCHHVDRPDVKVGPPLDQIGLQRVEYVIESILDPNANIPRGFEKTIVVWSDTPIAGVKQSEDEKNIVIANEKGESVTIPKAEITQDESGTPLIKSDPTSPMPGDYGALLGAQDFWDLLSYLVTLKFPRTDPSQPGH